MNEIKIYIVEDEPLITETIKVSLIKEGFTVVGEADNIGDAYFEIEDLRPDLVFLDITLENGQNGIDLGKKLNAKSNIPFIYLTSHSDKKTVEKASLTNPAGYLLKPFKSKDLKVAIDFAFSKIEPKNIQNKSDYIFVKHHKKWNKINVTDIIIAKADDTYTEVYTAKQKYLISQPLKNIESKLNSKIFRRVHRSYVVNINKITTIQDDILNIESHLIPIGKKYKKDLMSSLNFL